MSGRVAGDVDALRAVPGATELSLDGLARAGGELEEALEHYWARCPDFRPRWARLGPDLVGHAGRCRALGGQFGRVAGELARAGAVADLEPIWRRPEDGLAALAAADAAALDRARRLERADAVAPPVRTQREQHLAVGVSVGFAAAGSSLLWRIVELADGSVEVSLVDGVSAAATLGREAGGQLDVAGREVGIGVGVGATALLGDAQSWTKRFATRADADAFVRSGRARVLVEKAATGALWALGTFAGLAPVASSVLRRFTNRGFDEPTRTTEEVDVGLSGGLSGQGLGAEAEVGLAVGARLTVTEDHEAGTTTDTVLVGYSPASGVGGLLGGLLAEGAPAVPGGDASGEAALAVTRAPDGRALELRLTTVTSQDGGETLERTVRSLDLASPAHDRLADAMSSSSGSPAARVDELVRGAHLAAAGMGTAYTWGVVVRERYERQPTDGPDVALDPGAGLSGSLSTERYDVTRRIVR